ncbi:hypothetical protein ACJX0J_011703 [Zea mays]
MQTKINGVYINAITRMRGSDHIFLCLGFHLFPSLLFLYPLSMIMKTSCLFWISGIFWTRSTLVVLLWIQGNLAGSKLFVGRYPFVFCLPAMVTFADANYITSTNCTVIHFF